VSSTKPQAVYFNNRAAAYMALKKYKLALADCQRADSMESESSPPSTKTLLRIARCQLALGSLEDASKTLLKILDLDPGNALAVQEQFKVEKLGLHLFYFQSAKAKKEWGVAQVALDKCLQCIGGEGDDNPLEWRIWQVEMELIKCDLDSANVFAK
jgi:DnaJ homolog subfamily C member 7